MSMRVEIFGAGGVAVGVVARAGHLRDELESGAAILLEQTTWNPLDASPARPSGDLSVPPDDIHLATTDEADDMPVHAQWHDIILDVGPYRVRGQMPTMPGFDPGRALARPTGEFVQLRDVSIALLAEDDGSALTRPMALVNRYVVERVEADLMLGFFFPGAVMVGGQVDPAQAPAPAATTASPAPTLAPGPAGG
jgi:hypothetical protein